MYFCCFKMNLLSYMAKMDTSVIAWARHLKYKIKFKRIKVLKIKVLFESTIVVCILIPGLVLVFAAKTCQQTSVCWHFMATVGYRSFTLALCFQVFLKKVFHGCPLKINWSTTWENPTSKGRILQRVLSSFGLTDLWFNQSCFLVLSQSNTWSWGLKKGSTPWTWTALRPPWSWYDLHLEDLPVNPKTDLLFILFFI